ncbi:MAG TPA: VCBS repeat-containing protein [bacterium]|nr:VCBS repeat-containing protein [bacterium]
MRKNISTLFGVALLAPALLLPALSARAAEGDTKDYRFQAFEFAGAKHDRVVADLNGDGLMDLAIIYSRSNVPDTFWLRACLQDKAQGFTGACGDLKLGKEVRAFDVGEVDGKPGAELVVLTDKGVKVASFSGGKFGPLSSAGPERSILSGTEDNEPRLLRFLWDLDGDGKKEMVVPSIKGPAIYKHSETGFSLFQQINSPARVTYRVGSLGDIMNTDDVNQFLKYRTYEKRTTAHYTAPDVFIQDFNGDQKKDIIALIENTLRVFPQGDDGRFADQPLITVKKSILPAAEKGVGFAGEAMTFNDLNNDGLGDIIMMKWGSSQERTQMDRYIYYARPGLKYPAEPDQIVRSESAAVDFGMFDLNKDGKLDLVIPFFHFAPAQAFKVMTENSIKVQFRIFLMRPDGRYDQDPGKQFAKVDRRVQLNYKIDVIGIIFDFKTLLQGSFSPLISFGRDFNGDGFPDLVADTGDDKLQFYYGNADINYPTAPDMAIDFESATDFDLADLNGDGKTDIITYYESKERTQKKRELAKKARDQADKAPDAALDQALLTTPEGTRIKVLLSK